MTKGNQETETDRRMTWHTTLSEGQWPIHYKKTGRHTLQRPYKKTHTVMMGCHELPTKALTQNTALLCLPLNMTTTTLNQQLLHSPRVRTQSEQLKIHKQLAPAHQWPAVLIIELEVCLPVRSATVVLIMELLRSLLFFSISSLMYCICATVGRPFSDSLLICCQLLNKSHYIQEYVLYFSYGCFAETDSTQSNNLHNLQAL